MTLCQQSNLTFEHSCKICADPWF